MKGSAWIAHVRDSLIESKRDGLPFDLAWADAERNRYIPPADGGGRVPALFEADGMFEETVYSFFRRACEAAYTDSEDVLGSGNGRPVRHFGRELLDDGGGEPRAAVRSM